METLMYIFTRIIMLSCLFALFRLIIIPNKRTDPFDDGIY